MTKQEVIASIETAIKDQPTVLVRIFAGTLVNALKLLKDQQDIVRCGNCVNFIVSAENPNVGSCNLGIGTGELHPHSVNWFCAFEEQKDGDDE